MTTTDRPGNIYSVVIVQRYQILRNGKPIPDAYPALYVSSEAAQRGIAVLVAASAAEAAKAERIRKARASTGKWTPASLREAMAGDLHWEVEDLSDGPVYVDGMQGHYRCVWRELDPHRPMTNDSTGRVTPNYDLYGQMYIVYCNDAPDENGMQFELRDPSGDAGRQWQYATADRLASALIRRGLLDNSPEASKAE